MRQGGVTKQREIIIGVKREKRKEKNRSEPKSVLGIRTNRAICNLFRTLESFGRPYTPSGVCNFSLRVGQLVVDRRPLIMPVDT